MKDVTPTSDDFVLKLTPSEQAWLDQIKFDVSALEIDDAQSNSEHDKPVWKPFRLTCRLMSLSFAPVVTVASVSLVILYLLPLLLPANDHLAPTAALALNASPTDSEATPKAAKASATSFKRPPELTATSPMPALAAPPDEAAPAPAPDIPRTVATPALALPPKEPAPVVAVVAAAPTPGSVSAVVMSAPAAPPKEATPIVAVIPDPPTTDTAPTVSRPSPAVPPAVLRASVIEASALLTRGDTLLGAGDVASARQFYERATDAGNAQAALRLGETYDPSFLALARLNGVRGDLAVATRWYRRARELGNPEAEILLKSLNAN